MNALILAFALLLMPAIRFGTFYATIRAEGLTFTKEMKKIEGRRVRL